MSIESICNQALDIVGYKRHIGSIWDGTRAARVALDTWALTRDALLVTLRPDWARQDVGLTVIKSAPPYGYDDVTIWEPGAYPEVPWLYEYANPDLCLYPLALKPRPHTLPVWRPHYMRFRIKLSGNDYTLLGNDPAPILTCVSKAYDPDGWHEDFAEAMVETLAKKFARALGGGAPQERQEEGGRANAA